MLSTEEKRFIRYWEDQRTGGKLSYYLQYILGGAFIISLFVFVVLFFFLNFFVTAFILAIVPSCSAVASVMLTHFSWILNEKKMRNLIKREVNEGRAFDGK